MTVCFLTVISVQAEIQTIFLKKWIPDYCLWNDVQWIF